MAEIGTADCGGALYAYLRIGEAAARALLHNAFIYDKKQKDRNPKVAALFIISIRSCYLPALGSLFFFIMSNAIGVAINIDE